MEREPGCIYKYNQISLYSHTSWSKNVQVVSHPNIVLESSKQTLAGMCWHHSCLKIFTGQIDMHFNSNGALS